MKRRGLYTYLEDNGVCMREEHCLRGLGSAEESTEKRMLMINQLPYREKFHKPQILTKIQLFYHMQCWTAANDNAPVIC